MIRTLLALWLGPIVFFWSWYWLSLNDISFGLHFFSREMHDQMFGIYALLLGVEPEAVPPMIAKTLAVDSLLVLAIALFRKRRPIIAYVRGVASPRDGKVVTCSSSSIGTIDESLSKAP